MPRGDSKYTLFSGRSGWVQRVSTLAFVLIPRIYDSAREEERVASIACRVVHQNGLMPLYPPLFFRGFLTIEELEGAMKKLCNYWLARSSRLVIGCVDRKEAAWGLPEDIELDPLTFWALRANQSSSRSRAVSFLHGSASDSPCMVPLKAQQVDRLLMQNLRSGLVANCL